MNVMTLLRICFFCFLPLFMYSQHQHSPQCGMIDQRVLKERLQKNRMLYQKSAFDSTTRYIPMKLHLIAKEDGTGRVDFSQVMDEICITNALFEDTGFVFYISEGVNYINDDSLYNYAGSYMDTLTYRTQLVQQLKRDIGPNAINIFISNEAGLPGVAGFNNPFLDFIFVRKSQIGTGSTTFAHEIGHFLSLQHPHLGWEGEPYEREIHGDTVRITEVGFDNTPVEWMNKENCEIAGDGICDTPPDYNFGFLWSPECPRFSRIVWDINGDTIVTSQTNIMSYFRGCDNMGFSAGQVEAMVWDLESEERTFLEKEYIPDTSSITDPLVLYQPGFNQTAEFHNSVQVEWSSLRNASEYYIRLLSNGKETTYFTQDTVLLLTDLEPRRSYSILVHGYNETGGCGQKVNSIFRTSDATTSINDPSFFDAFSVYPNPIRPNENLIIELSSSISLDSSFEIISPQGQIHFSMDKKIIIGENKIVLPIDQFASSIYYLKMNTPKGHYIRKLFIHN